ncbi:MAG: phosphoribosylpyrophosphate synthetase [Alphaproteobacteria bacterium TMED62]|nr:MAG: phosphoribosylpyrophosphate synthetase [Alphaproteobacteria bacterium TMED62]|tara:strand:+ start:7966 stop:8895 length:930 start_codon:yes stop_codon:yes gene_type:complete
MKLLACNSNLVLSEEIAATLNIPLTKASIKKFSDEEIFVEVNENVRGQDVYVIQSTSKPANDNLVELLVCIDALKRASAKQITAVIPYFGYARQDRKPGPRTPISAKLVANLITKSGADRVLTIDLHAGQIQGFFDIPVDNLYAAPILLDDIKKNYNLDNTVIISPDVGGVVRARYIANRLNISLAIVDKRREATNISEVLNIIGDVKEKDCILIDDIVDTAGTLTNAGEALLKVGAKTVSAYVSHGVLSGLALERIKKSALKELVTTNTIYSLINDSNNKIRRLSVAPLIAEALKRIDNHSSVSSLFN